MNIVDIKKRVKEEFYIKRDIDFYEAQEDISALLSIIELLEQDLTYMKQYGELSNLDGKMKICIERALQTLSKGGGVKI